MPTQLSNWSDATLSSLYAAMAMLFAAVPRIIGFAVILIVGWLVAALVAKALAAVLHAVKFNTLAERAGLAGFMEKAGQRSDASAAMGGIVKWFIRLIALMVAFDALGLPAVSDVLRQLLLWLPNLVVALLALVIGGIAANALGNLVRGAAAEGDLDRPELLGKIAKVAVWAFAIVVAINQIGVATALVNTLFMATVGAVALALGLSFGLGGRDTAGTIVRRWYGRAADQAPQIRRAVDSAANQATALRTGDAGAERRLALVDRRAEHSAAM
jgi:small-conductance mechanosensitive channel